MDHRQRRCRCTSTGSGGRRCSRTWSSGEVNLCRRTATSAPPLQPTPGSGGMAPSIVGHHERTNFVGPEQPSATPCPAARIDSTTMTDPDPVAHAQPTLDPLRKWSAPPTQLSLDKSAQVCPCSSQVVEPEEVVLPRVLEELPDDVFTPLLSPQPGGAASTTATGPSSTTDTVPSTTDTVPDTDSGAEDRQGQKLTVNTSDTSYSQAHRTTIVGPSNYPKQPNRPRPLAVSRAEDNKGQKRAVATSETSYSQEHRTASTGPSNYPKRPNHSNQLRGRPATTEAEANMIPRQRLFP